MTTNENFVFATNLFELIAKINGEADFTLLNKALTTNGFPTYDFTVVREYKLKNIICKANKLNLALPENFTQNTWRASGLDFAKFQLCVEQYFSQFSVNDRIEQLVKELLVTDFQQFPNVALYEKELEAKEKQGYEIVVNKRDKGCVDFVTTVLINPTVKFKSRHNSSKLEELYKLVTGEKADLPFIGDSTPKENNEVYQLYVNRVFVFKSPAFNKALVPVVKKVVQQTSHATAFKSNI